jgi:hypothetical protein
VIVGARALPVGAADEDEVPPSVAPEVAMVGADVRDGRFELPILSSEGCRQLKLKTTVKETKAVICRKQAVPSITSKNRLEGQQA